MANGNTCITISQKVKEGGMDIGFLLPMQSKKILGAILYQNSKKEEDWWDDFILNTSYTSEQEEPKN